MKMYLNDLLLRKMYMIFYKKDSIKNAVRRKSYWYTSVREMYSNAGCKIARKNGGRRGLIRTGKEVYPKVYEVRPGGYGLKYWNIHTGATLHT